MPKVRVYVDTSVFGGVHDEEFARASRRFFERVRADEYVVLLSAAVAPEELEAVGGLPSECAETVGVDDEVRALADHYRAFGVLDKADEGAALEVAAATIADADLLLTWDFKRLASYRKNMMFSGVNLLKGYRPLDIRSPLVLEYTGGE